MKDPLIKQCANPRCGDWFVHQSGTHVRPRLKGVSYCSVRCRDAHRKRVYRARKKAAAYDALMAEMGATG